MKNVVASNNGFQIVKKHNRQQHEKTMSFKLKSTFVYQPVSTQGGSAYKKHGNEASKKPNKASTSDVTPNSGFDAKEDKACSKIMSYKDGDLGDEDNEFGCKESYDEDPYDDDVSKDLTEEQLAYCMLSI
ncbi:hypothetical protein Tco_0567953 [Tanacetum coccineum]